MSSALRSYFGVLELVHAEVDRVDQGGAVFRLDHDHACLDVVDVGGVVDDDGGAIVEADDKELILRIAGAHELRKGLPGARELRGHAAGEVEHDANGDRGVLSGKGFDDLPLVIVEDIEVFFFKAGDQAVHRVGNRHWDKDKVDVYADCRWAAGGRRFRIGIRRVRISGSIGCGLRFGGSSDGRVYIAKEDFPARMRIAMSQSEEQKHNQNCQTRLRG